MDLFKGTTLDGATILTTRNHANNNPHPQYTRPVLKTLGTKTGFIQFYKRTFKDIGNNVFIIKASLFASQSNTPSGEISAQIIYVDGSVKKASVTGLAGLRLAYEIVSGELTVCLYMEKTTDVGNYIIVPEYDFQTPSFWITYQQAVIPNPVINGDIGFYVSPTIFTTIPANYTVVNPT